MKIDWGLVKTDIKDFVKFCCHLFLQTLGFGVVLMMGFIIPAILYSKNYILWLWLWLIIFGIISVVIMLFVFYRKENSI